jgi:cell division protein FtsQ
MRAWRRRSPAPAAEPVPRPPSAASADQADGGARPAMAAAAARADGGGAARARPTPDRTGRDAAEPVTAGPTVSSAAGAQAADSQAAETPATGVPATDVPVAGAPAPAGRPGKSGRRPRDPWRTAFFGVLALAILAGAAWALLGSSLLVVKHEDVSGNRLVSSSEVLAAAGVRPGTPLASVNTAAVARRIEQIAQVLTATVSRSWPNTVVIVVHERTPALAVASGGRFALIDGFGVTVRWSRYRPASMPLLRQPPARLRGNAGIKAAVAVIERLPPRLHKLVLSVSAPSPYAVTLALRGGITVAWGSAQQGTLKAAELAVLLRTSARYLDVSDPHLAVTQR